jgi:hypothetical protein
VEVNLVLALMLVVVGGMLGIAGLSFLETVPFVGNLLFILGLLLGSVGFCILMLTIRNIERNSRY